MSLKFEKITVQNNFITIFIFCFFLLSIFLGPSIVNFSHTVFVLFFLYKLTQSNLKINFSPNMIIILQLIFCLYLALNTFFINSEFSFNGEKSLFYFRFFLFAFIISQILSLNTKSIKIISIIFCTVSILLSLDIFLQYITGFDIFSYKAGLCVYPDGEQYYDPKNCERFSGFFGKEFIAGSFLSTYGLYFTFLTFQLINSSKLKKFILFLIFVILILAIIITGERNAILSLVLIVIFNIFFNKEIRKYLLYVSLLGIVILIFSFFNFKHVKYRYLDWPLNYIQSKEGNILQKLSSTPWGAHYVISSEIFSNNLLFGKGYKSFRYECRKEKYNFENLNQKYNLSLLFSGCTTHPHNLYFEILAENGILGFILFMLILYFLIIEKFRKRSLNIFNDKLLIFTLSIIFSFLFPLRPTGSISATIYGTHLWFFIGFYLFFVKNPKYEK